MIRKLFTSLVDEIAANILLHGFLRDRRGPVCKGPDRQQLSGLYSGELHAFYAPAPTAVDLESGRALVGRSAERTVWDCRFPSETTSAWPESDTVWCRHWESHRGDSGLTVVGVDGIVQLGSRWFNRLASRLNPLGIDVLMMDAPGNFRRTPAGYRPGQLIVAGELPHQLAMTRQAVLDLWRVIISVQRQGRRVGLVGVSYGGWLTLLAALLAADLEFLIALAPPVDLVQMLRESTTIVRGIRRGLGFARLDPDELERMARPVLPARWSPRLSGSRIVLHAARYDRLVPCRGIERLAKQWQTRLVHHDDAHYGVAVATATTAQIAEEVVEMSSDRSKIAV